MRTVLGLLSTFTVVIALLWMPAAAQDARGALDAATVAMGGSTLRGVEYTATSGNTYRMGAGSRFGPALAAFHRDTLLDARELRRAGHARGDGTRRRREAATRRWGRRMQPADRPGGIRPIPFGPDRIG